MYIVETDKKIIKYDVVIEVNGYYEFYRIVDGSFILIDGIPKERIISFRYENT